MGGEIDIAIELESLCIAIENKIEAKDQVKQLSRYYNSLKNGNKELLLLYLTLDGNEPSKQSAGDLIKNSNYFLLSYKRHIISWLTLCHNAASDKQILRETIKQYKILIEKLTGQLTHQKMNEKLIKLISNNYEDSKLIYQNFKKAQNEIKVNIMKKVLSNLTADSALKKYNINKNLDTEKAPHISIRNQTWREGLLAYLEHNNGKSFFEIGIVNIGEKLSDLEKENLKKGENLKSENWITSKKTYLSEYTLTNTQENISEIANQLTTKLLKVLNDDQTNWTI